MSWVANASSAPPTTPNTHTTFLFWFLDVAAPLKWLTAYWKLCPNSWCQNSTMTSLCCTFRVVRNSVDVMANTESRVNCVCSVGGGRNMGLMIDDEEEEEENCFFLLLLFSCCFYPGWQYGLSEVGAGWESASYLLAGQSHFLQRVGGSVRSHRSVQASSACSTCTDAAYICSTCCDAAYIFVWSTCSQAAYVACALNWCSTCQCDRTAGSVPAI